MSSYSWDGCYGDMDGIITVNESVLEFQPYTSKTAPLVSVSLQRLSGARVYSQQLKVRIQNKYHLLEFQFTKNSSREDFINTFQQQMKQFTQSPQPSSSPPSNPSLPPLFPQTDEIQDISKKMVSSGLVERKSPGLANSPINRSIVSPSSPRPEAVPLDKSLIKSVGPKEFIITAVSNPERVIQNNESYIIYNVNTKTNLASFKSDTIEQDAFVWNVRHRFKDFENFYEVLAKNNPKASVPILPKKSWMNKFNSGFVENRAQELHKFLQQICSNHILQQSVELRNFLTTDHHKRARKDESLNQPKTYFETYLQDNPLTCVVESTITETLFTKKNAPVFTTQVEEDYEIMKQMMKKWEIVPTKLPFEKFMVLVLGTTSAGKSSWVNNFFGISCKKSADCQQDTVFTIVETVPASVFERYRNSMDASPEFPEFTEEELKKNIDDVYADSRYGNVFIVLDTAITLTRYYTQLAQFSTVITNLGLFQTVLINEHYLSKFAGRELATRTILIDSPGFGSEKKSGSDLVENFLGNLKVLQALYKLSDLSLFFVPATQLNMVSNQLAILELSIIYSLVGMEKMEALILSCMKGNEDEDMGFFSNVLKKMGNKIIGHVDEHIYQGTAVWEKTLFILTKIDLLQPTEDAMRHIYYELGCLIKKSFLYLPNPVPDHILTMALPEKSLREAPSHLKSLNEKLKALSLQSPFEKRVELSIQSMCNELKRTVGQSWAKYLTYDTTEIDKILDRSVKRMHLMI